MIKDSKPKKYESKEEIEFDQRNLVTNEEQKSLTVGTQMNAELSPQM